MHGLMLLESKEKDIASVFIAQEHVSSLRLWIKI